MAVQEKFKKFEEAFIEHVNAKLKRYLNYEIRKKSKK